VPHAGPETYRSRCRTIADLRRRSCARRWPDQPAAGSVPLTGRRLPGSAQEVSAAIESMNGARFVHDTLELAGWDVEIADAVKPKSPKRFYA